MMPVRLEPAALGLELNTLPLSHCAPYPSVLTYVLGAQKNRLNEMVLLNPQLMFLVET